MAPRIEAPTISRPQVLLVHDFCSSPAELKPIGRVLSQHGFHCTAPLLPGHGEGPGSMRVCTLADWTEALTDSYLALQKRGQPIILLGAGLGANLCMALSEQVFPRGLVSLAPILSKDVLPKVGRKAVLRAKAVPSELVSTRSYLNNGCHCTLATVRQKYSHLEIPAEFAGLALETLKLLDSGARNPTLPQLWIRPSGGPGERNPIWKRLRDQASSARILDQDSPCRLVWLSPGRIQLYREIANFVSAIV